MIGSILNLLIVDIRSLFNGILVDLLGFLLLEHDSEFVIDQLESVSLLLILSLLASQVQVDPAELFVAVQQVLGLDRLVRVSFLVTLVSVLLADRLLLLSHEALVLLLAG